MSVGRDRDRGFTAYICDRSGRISIRAIFAESVGVLLDAVIIDIGIGVDSPNIRTGINGGCRHPNSDVGRVADRCKSLVTTLDELRDAAVDGGSRSRIAGAGFSGQRKRMGLRNHRKRAVIHDIGFSKIGRNTFAMPLPSMLA